MAASRFYEPSKTIVIHGMRKVDWQVQMAMLFIGPIVFLVVIFLTIGGSSSDLIQKVLIAAATVVIVDLLLLEIVSYPRRIVLSHSAVRLEFRLHAVTKTWEEVIPEMRPSWGYYAGQGWFLSVWIGRPTAAPRRKRGFLLTDEQAREVIRYPSGVVWHTTPEFQRLLLMLADPPSPRDTSLTNFGS